jgi:hypothetical protein
MYDFDEGDVHMLGRVSQELAHSQDEASRLAQENEKFREVLAVFGMTGTQINHVLRSADVRQGLRAAGFNWRAGGLS